MSTVKLSRIRISDGSDKVRHSTFGEPAVHIDSGILYIPDPDNDRVLRIETENDKMLEPIPGIGKVSRVTICQDRDLAFAVIKAEKEIRALRTSGEGSVFSLKFDFYPSRAAFDGDRDLLLVIGTDELETDINTRIAFFSFPDCRMIQAVSVKGNAESVRYDELEDSFRILQNNPGQVLTLSPSLGLDKFHSFSLGDEKGVTFEVCPTEKKIVVGTLNGKILSLDSEEKGFKVLASFKEPVSKIMYNPLVNHLYVAFKESRNLAVIDMEIARIREVVRCSSEVSELAFDEKHNKIYALLAGISSIEIYLDQGR